MATRKVIETMEEIMFQKIMDEIEITKQTLRQGRQEMKIEFNKMTQELKEIGDSVKEVFDGIRDEKRKIKGKPQALEIGTSVKLEKDLEFMDVRNKVYRLEFKVVSEEINEDFGGKVTNALDNFLDWNDVMEFDIEKIYGVGYRYVTVEKLLRDEPVHFVKKKNRDMTLQQYFSNIFRILDWNDVMGLVIEKIYGINYKYVTEQRCTQNRDVALQQYFSNIFRIDGKDIFVMGEIPIRLLLYDYGYDSKIIIRY
ncbi:uncharacterized protein LOC133365029 [Rhineura floridana]|uniref:uncharacterized protein LOC133365029 n=1 Tax=Rhineura floridana TaxID=261503 RepID=UPI002AC82365|nr:uncharacterized protein LOC133365029 [Rhineura floridana]XP_061442208.1 uncharacterized protein LOC133365029 [Rhineura floridana]